MKISNITKYKGKYMKSTNPFTIIFGIEPPSLIPRLNEYNTITGVFSSETPKTYAYVITGVRGCGKTVLMTSVQKYFSKQKNWLVIRLNPDLDLYISAVNQLRQQLSNSKDITEFNVSIAGFGGGISLQENNDSELELKTCLKKAKDKGKRVLIVIDEVTNTEKIRTFAHSYQTFIGEGLPAFLIMTALPENFAKLSKSPQSSFLRRLPKIKLGSLDMIQIETSYSKIFKIPRDEASELSKVTGGYSYAYQLLGDLLWESGSTKITEDILNELDGLLSDGAYSLIWEGLSEKEKQISIAIAKSPTSGTREIREAIGLKPNEFAPYRERLAESGIIDITERGKVRFTLPRFNEFVISMSRYEE